MIARMQERIQLLKAEVEGRGSSWLEFSTVEELVGSLGKEGEERLVNGTEGQNGEGEGQERTGSNPWTDGTFQTGRIVNGEMRVDENSTSNGPTNGTSTTGGRLDDEALRLAMEERMRALATDDDDEGVHL